MKKYSNKDSLTKWITSILVNSFALIVASRIFSSLYISSFLWAIITSIVISILNYTIKPILTILSIPITVLSLGILYPIVNVIVLKIASLIVGDYFMIKGWLMPFFIAIFIAIFTVIIQELIKRK